MASTFEKGQNAEKIAVEYLNDKGYKILHRNWRYFHKELDIVAVHNEILLIVEVKSRLGHYGETPSEMVSFGKMKHLVNAAEAYIFKYNIAYETRFDVISVTFFNDESYAIEHIEGAFVPGVNWS
jgi:putative endonuclease